MNNVFHFKGRYLTSLSYQEILLIQQKSLMKYWDWHLSNYIPITALIMTGGQGDDELRSVEVYIPSTNTSCFLRSLPGLWRSRLHSQDGLMMCGGAYAPLIHSCYKFNTISGEWIKTHNLTESRRGHSSWQREDGTVVLMGSFDDDSRWTTEIVSDSSAVSTPGFSLGYNTKWVVLCLYHYPSLDKAGLEVKSS